MRFRKITSEQAEVVLELQLPKGVAVMRMPADEALLCALSILREVANAYEHPAAIPPLNHLPVIRDALRDLLR